MELDEYSNDSTITNLSIYPDDSPFLFDTKEFEYTPSIEELKPKINNVVSSAYLGCNLNLKNIAFKIKNAEFNTSKASTLILKSNDNNTSATIFSNGKMVCTGAKNEKESKSSCKRFANMIKKVGFNIELKEFKIQNIVASYDIQFQISLICLYNKINSLINNNDSNFGKDKNNYCKFNKDILPGIVFYLNESKIRFLIFESGKVVVSGAKKRKEIEYIFKKIYPVLIECKKSENEEK